MKTVLIQVFEPQQPELERLEKLRFAADKNRARFTEFVRRAAYEKHPDKKVRISAVLVPLVFNRDNELEVLLTVRHSKISLLHGEVCLPGGECDRQDESVFETATREAWEEVGLHAGNINVLFEFVSMLSTRRKKIHVVHPIFALVKKSFYAKLNNHEVMDVFTVPLKVFCGKPEIKKMKLGWRQPCVSRTGVATIQKYETFGLTFHLLCVAANVMYGGAYFEKVMEGVKYFSTELYQLYLDLLRNSQSKL